MADNPQPAAPKTPTPIKQVTESVSEATEKIKTNPKLKWILIGSVVIIVLIILLVLGLIFLRGKTNTAVEQWQQYHSDSLGFSISHPTTWTVTETDAASGPDILIAEQNSAAFVRIRGFLDINLTSTEAIQASIEQYQKTISLQPDVLINSMKSKKVNDNVTEFTITGEFPVADTNQSFEEKGMLTTTGRVLIIRMADMPTNFDTSSPTMRKIVDSFSFGQPTAASIFKANEVLAAEALITMGEVIYNVTDYQGNPVEITDSRAQGYAASLRGDLVNAGIRLTASGHMRDELIRQREENNQLNQGHGGHMLMTNENGDAFWGYNKYSTDLPDPTYTIDTRINIRHRDESGDTQDIIVSVRVYDSQTGQLLSTSSVEKENTARAINKQTVGSEPTWWEKHISGYGRELTYEDALRTAVSEAANDAAGKLSTLSNQEIESDAARFARSLEESGYKPLVPTTDETSLDSVSDPDRDPGCPYFYATGTIDGPRTCFQTQAELNTALGVDSDGQPISDTAPPFTLDGLPESQSPSEIYLNPQVVEYTKWIGTVGGDLAASRQGYIDAQRETYRNNPAPGYSSEEEFISAFTKALDQALSSGSGSSGSSSSESSELKARVDEVGTHVYDGPDTYEGPSSNYTVPR